MLRDLALLALVRTTWTLSSLTRRWDLLWSHGYGFNSFSRTRSESLRCVATLGWVFDYRTREASPCGACSLESRLH